ncbi:MAG: V-type ATP synthase subunit I [Ruminococcus sp.]|nr:V-type ATP synthase subunit I [Ruminococcus sp.]
MAKLKMKKIELIAPLTDGKAVVELLQRRGVIEICENTDAELEQTNVTAIMGEFEKFRSTVSYALDILEKYVPEKVAVAYMFGSRSEIEKHDFGEQSKQLEKILNCANEIIRSSKTISDAKAEYAQLDVKSDMLRQWKNLDVPLNFKGTATTTAFIGSFSGQLSAEEVEEKLPDGCSAEVISGSKEQTNFFIICSKDVADEAEDILRKNSFVPISENPPLTPMEIIVKNETQQKKLASDIDSAERTINSLADMRDKLKFAVDFLTMRKDKYDAVSKLGITKSAFVLNGYIPEKYCESIEKEISRKFTAVVDFYDPDEDEDVPVLLENGSFSSPVESITKMYAMPSKSDVDPTSVMSFFYYLFFGMMLSDAGYGLLMVIGTVIALKKFNLEKSMKKTLIMFRNCGISTVIWGALFGSWFGDIVQVVAREFFDKEIDSIALWFQPLDNPIKLLLFSFLLGIIHLFVGVGVSFKMSWDNGRKLDAFLDTVPVYLTIIGVAPLASSILTDVPEILKSIGMYVMLTGIVLLILTAGRTSKSIFGKFFGGLYALYNTATGWLGDILSYSRLLALGLATGCIASVINLIGTMPENKIIKLILLIVVFIVGHIANLAINLLGAYVHTDRLQFVELFSKFYTGGGREFNPFTVNTKYIKFKEENSK